LYNRDEDYHDRRDDWWLNQPPKGTKVIYHACPACGDGTITEYQTTIPGRYYGPPENWEDPEELEPEWEMCEACGNDDPNAEPPEEA